MKNIQKQNITELSEFNSSISLWQMIPSGKGKGIALLKTIVDSILNNNKSRIPSVLIVGREGKRTHARAFVRSLGIEQIDETHASLLQPGSDITQFFQAGQNTAHIITGAESLWVAVQSVIIEILRNGKFQLYNYMKEQLDTFEVPGPLLLTAGDADKVPRAITDAVDFVIEIEKYSPEQLELVVLQRLKYCGLEFECEQVLTDIVSGGNGSLGDVIEFLKICIVVMKADYGRDILMLSDVEKAGKIG